MPHACVAGPGPDEGPEAAGCPDDDAPSAAEPAAVVPPAVDAAQAAPPAPLGPQLAVEPPADARLLGFQYVRVVTRPLTLGCARGEVSEEQNAAP